MKHISKFENAKDITVRRVKKMDWQEKILKEVSELASSDVKWEDFPKRLKRRLRLMTFIWDYLTWDAVKSGWRMPRLKFRQWVFYKKHPWLKDIKLLENERL